MGKNAGTGPYAYIKNNREFSDTLQKRIRSIGSPFLKSARLSITNDMQSSICWSVQTSFGSEDLSKGFHDKSIAG